MYIVRQVHTFVLWPMIWVKSWVVVPIWLACAAPKADVSPYEMRYLCANCRSHSMLETGINISSLPQKRWVIGPLSNSARMMWRVFVMGIASRPLQMLLLGAGYAV